MVSTFERMLNVLLTGIDEVSPDEDELQTLAMIHQHKMQYQPSVLLYYILIVHAIL